MGVTLVHGAALACAVVLLALGAALIWRARSERGGAFCAGPHNVGLYDRPYHHYPSYEGRGATWWDPERRCTSWCQQSPCTVWCR